MGGQPPIDPKSDLPENQTPAMTRFKKDQTAQKALAKVVPFLVEDELKRLGAVFEKILKWQPHSIIDGRLVTRENPASSTSAAQALLDLLAAQKAV
jgi:putative intracellular protease/amidase